MAIKRGGIAEDARVLILGAGISGLVAARDLASAPRGSSYATSDERRLVASRDHFSAS